MDLEDEGQTVNFVESPEIGTTATVDGQHTADPIGEITIVDAVEYSGLNPGQTYTVSGILMDKGTGEALLVDGAEVTAETEFTPEAASGTVELTYTLDASALAGTTIVVFETLYSDGVEIAIHADINDEDQTIIIAPKGGLLIQKTSEDGVLEGFTFLVESENYSETFTTDGAGKINSEAYFSLEYRHGPMSLVDKNTLIIFLSHSETVKEDAKLLAQMKEYGAVTVAIGNTASADLKDADYCLDLPYGYNDTQNAAIIGFIGQFIGYYIAEKKGIDADSPRHLSQAIVISA